ncbi:DUF6481 family protein [Methylopila sp. 73B]|uniref:DUF6481 family protein n=1 Tax=Methylopila sp. 73B TaxID=1120792 RepID=UPI001FDA550A|nr:DUF6481 family protein [Methylopila sp. 73B]
MPGAPRLRAQDPTVAPIAIVICPRATYVRRASIKPIGRSASHMLKDDSFESRRNASLEAKKDLLARFRTAAEDPAAKKRMAERAAIAAAREARERAKEEERRRVMEAKLAEERRIAEMIEAKRRAKEEAAEAARLAEEEKRVAAEAAKKAAEANKKITATTLAARALAADIMRMSGGADSAYPARKARRAG